MSFNDDLIELFNKLDENKDGLIGNDKIKRILNIMNVSPNISITRNKYSLNDLENILEESILNNKEKIMIKYNDIEKYLNQIIDKTTSKFILFKIYGNLSPLKKVDITKLDNFISNYIKKSNLELNELL